MNITTRTITVLIHEVQEDSMKIQEGGKNPTWNQHLGIADYGSFSQHLSETMNWITAPQGSMV